MKEEISVKNEPLLAVEDLHVYSGEKELVRGTSLSVFPGESIGIVGESGSGKTMTLRALIGLLPEGVKAEYASFHKDGNIAMIFQNPVSALDPLARVGSQIAEVIMLHDGSGRAEAKQAALRLMERLSLPKTLYDRFPWELSGGQCQRIDIAIALACRPDILLCDEPTTALDVTVQKRTLELIADLQKELGFAIVFVTHNLAVASQMCKRIMVMQDGRIIEEGNTSEIIHAPKEKYTQLLMEAILPLN